MQLLTTTRAEDHLKSPSLVPTPLVLDSLLGEWINTNPLGAGVAKLIVTQDSREALLQIFGSGSPSFVDWGKAPIETIFAKDVTSSEPMAFEARFNLGFLAVHAQANFSLGLLVLACFNTFKDGSGRRNYFSREFFHRNDIEEAAN